MHLSPSDPRPPSEGGLKDPPRRGVSGRMGANFLYLILCLLAGCSRPPAPPQSLSQADERFLQICRDEIQAFATIKHAGKTLGIYVPLEKGLFEFKTSPPLGLFTAPEEQSTEQSSVLFLKVNFENQTFQIKYDISRTRKYNKAMNYQTAFTESFNRIQSNVINTIKRVYFDLDASRKEEIPDFVVLVFMDTSTGVGMKLTFAFEDLKRALSEPASISQEEYVKRQVSEVVGDESFIGDKQGKNFQIEDIVWPDFLAKQMENRINFKYQRSDFPPSQNTPEELLGIAALTAHYYNFENFESVLLHDLGTDTKNSYTREYLKGIKTE